MRLSRRPQPIAHRTRRKFLGDVGKGSVAMAVLSPALLAACSSDGAQDTGTAATTSSSSTTTASATTNAVDETTTTQPADDAAPADTEAEALRWARAELGFVSAYVLARGNTAAIVDTGVAGSADAIGQSLSDLGLNYSDVAHVVLTHHHGDHAGSIAEVMDRAVNATVYAGEADLDEVSFDTITGLAGGEDIFGFEALHTPGHTAGHIAVIDHDAGLLVAGDAIFTDGTSASEGPERFFDDVPLSRDSIRAMAALNYNTLLVGHGDPIEGGANDAVAALAASFS